MYPVLYMAYIRLATASDCEPQGSNTLLRNVQHTHGTYPKTLKYLFMVAGVCSRVLWNALRAWILHGNPFFGGLFAG